MNQPGNVVMSYAVLLLCQTLTLTYYNYDLVFHDLFIIKKS